MRRPVSARGDILVLQVQQMMSMWQLCAKEQSIHLRVWELRSRSDRRLHITTKTALASSSAAMMDESMVRFHEQSVVRAYGTKGPGLCKPHRAELVRFSLVPDRAISRVSHRNKSLDLCARCIITNCHSARMAKRSCTFCAYTIVDKTLLILHTIKNGLSAL